MLPRIALFWLVLSRIKVVVLVVARRAWQAGHASIVDGCALWVSLLPLSGCPSTREVPRCTRAESAVPQGQNVVCATVPQVPWLRGLFAVRSQLCCWGWVPPRASPAQQNEGYSGLPPTFSCDLTDKWSVIVAL